MEWHQRFEIARKKIKELLAKDNLRDTDDNAAVFLETSLSTFRRWKLGTQMPDAESLIRISKKLGISIDWLLLGEGEKDLSAALTKTISPATCHKQCANLQEADNFCRVRELELEMIRLQQDLIEAQNEVIKLLRDRENKGTLDPWGASEVPAHGCSAVNWPSGDIDHKKEDN